MACGCCTEVIACAGRGAACRSLLRDRHVRSGTSAAAAAAAAAFDAGWSTACRAGLSAGAGLSTSAVTDGSACRLAVCAADAVCVPDADGSAEIWLYARKRPGQKLPRMLLPATPRRCAGGCASRIKSKALPLSAAACTAGTSGAGCDGRRSSPAKSFAGDAPAFLPLLAAVESAQREASSAVARSHSGLVGGTFCGIAVS